jgi:Cu(I)/Ag(I) efflux system membrane fusion protein
MNNKITLALLIVIALSAGYFAGTRLNDPGQTTAAAEAAPAEREILYWVAPMDPNFRRDKPGKSPMGMDLVPVYADEASSEAGVRISPAMEQNLGVRTEVAQVRPLWRRIQATGYVGFDETLISHVNLRTQGWIVTLAVNAEGERVAAGDLLFELYSPELVNAQKEFLQALQRGDKRLQGGAEEKLRALGMVPGDVEKLAATGKASERIQVLAPQDGVVFDLTVREGMYVQPNTTVLSLAGLSSVWLQAEVFESQAEWVAPGQAAEARLDYLPGQVFTGQVDYVYPVLDPKTRTLRVRLRFDNPEERLKPNMYAQVSIYGKLQPNALSIPREALIRAPGRDRVVVALGDGRFDVHEVMTGMESGDWVEIIAGIQEGERIVTSAQFLIDSEASLAGSIRRLEALPAAADREPLERVFASGKVDAVDPKARRLQVSHGPIDALAWPSMTMEFDVDDGVRLEQVAVGQDIRFALRQEHAGHWVVSQINGRETLDSVSPKNAEALAAPVPPEPGRYRGAGTVKAVDAERRVITMAHDPIEALGWPGMTMDFKLSGDIDPGRLRPGQDVAFQISKGDDGLYVVVELEVLDAAPAAEEHDHD